MAFEIPNPIVANTPAVAADVEENFQKVEDALGAGTSGQLIVCDASGNPRPVSLSGDGTLSAAGALTIAAGAVDAAELASALAEDLGVTGGGTTRRAYAEVLTEQTNPGPTWGDLATVGPSVTVTGSLWGFVLIGVAVEMKSASPPNTVAVAVHEATDWNTAGSTDADGSERILEWTSGSYSEKPLTAFKLIPVTAGSRTFTLKYGAAQGGTFKNRKLWAIAMGF